MPISSYALIAANLIPLGGVLFFHWDVVLVLALFWIENLIIGAFNLLRILSATIVSRQWSGLFTGAFFVFHYGAFCAVHGMLLTDLLGYPDVGFEQYFNIESAGILEIFLDGAAIFLNFTEQLAPAIWLALAGLLLSHTVSFVEHFILRGEILRVGVRKLMARPYSYIVVMHVGLIVGAIVVQKSGSPMWLLAIIVLLKLVVDYKLHRRRHLAPVQHTV